jgi:hypothetical protein
VLDQVQAGHAVVDMRAYRLTGADGLGGVGKADPHFLQVSEKRAVVLIADRLVDAGFGVRRRGEHESERYAKYG